MEREGVGWWIFLGFDLKSGCRDSGLWILMLDLKSGCRDSGLWILNVGSEEWGQIDPKSGWILGDFRM